MNYYIKIILRLYERLIKEKINKLVTLHFHNENIKNADKGYDI